MNGMQRPNIPIINPSDHIRRDVLSVHGDQDTCFTPLTGEYIPTRKVPAIEHCVVVRRDITPAILRGGLTP